MEDKSMKSTLIIGGDSTIGSALAASLAKENIPCIATSRRENSGHLQLNLAAHPDSWPELPKAEIAYFCAAITKLDICESDPETTSIINVKHLQALAEKLQASGTFIVFLSSNQVFNGESPYPKTTDTPNPMNEYGKQKASFEKWLLARPYPAAVLRLTKVLSGPLPMLLQWEKTLSNNQTIEAFDNLIFAPIPLAAVLLALTDIGTHKRPGIFHLSGTHDISYHMIAEKLAARLGVSPDLVRRVSAEHKGVLPQFLPKHGTLKSSEFEGVSIPNPEQVINGRRAADR